MLYLGIDLGTSNSCIAFYDDKTGRREVVKPRIEERILKRGYVTPTVVAINQEGHLFAAGYFAKVCSQVMGSIVIDKVKTWIGKSFDEVIMDDRLANLGYNLIPVEGMPVVERGGNQYNAVSIVTYFLKYLIFEGLKTLKENGVSLDNEEITLIVTYPAYYLQNQVDAIRDSVQRTVTELNRHPDKPGAVTFSGLKIIPEPLATVCTAISENKVDQNDRYILVIDEGAGTLDVMLVEIKSARMDQLNVGQSSVVEASGVTIGGMERLGGVDMDNAIYDWLRLESLKEGYDLKTLNTLEQLILMSNIEDAKIVLAEGEVEEVQISIPKFSQVKKLTNKQMYELIDPIIEDCRQSVCRAIKEIEKIKDDFAVENIDKVILIGGPTKMDLFKRKMEECTHKTAIENVNPMEYVALGAAVSPSIKYRVPVERTYGLIKKTGDTEEFERIIEKDTHLPVKQTIPYPVDDFEGTIAIEVGQIYSESDIEIVCKKMGKYIFYIPPKKSTFYLTFLIDEERKIEIAITDSQAKARNFEQGIIDPSLFKLEFIRESNAMPTVISKEHESVIDPVILEALRQNAGLIFRYLRDGFEQKGIAEKVLTFGLSPEKREKIEQLKNQLEISIQSLNDELNSIIQQIEVVNGRVTEQGIQTIRTKVKQIGDSEELADLVKRINLIKHEFQDIRDEMTYDSMDIQQLLDKISATQTRSAELLKRRGTAISSNKKKEIVEIMGELDDIKIKLEKKRATDIFVISLDGNEYRKGASKEQMLKNIIDQFG